LCRLLGLLRLLHLFRLLGRWVVPRLLWLLGLFELLRLLLWLL
jgi:hypothetical protein